MNPTGMLSAFVLAAVLRHQCEMCFSQNLTRAPARRQPAAGGHCLVLAAAAIARGTPEAPVQVPAGDQLQVFVEYRQHKLLERANPGLDGFEGKFNSSK